MKIPAILIAFLALATSACFAATAQENWDSHCKKCHAADGSGKTTIGKKLKLADYTTAEAQASFTDEQAVDVITNGAEENGKKKMNAYSDKLSTEEIADLVKLVRSFGPAKSASVDSGIKVTSAGCEGCAVASCAIAKTD